MLEISFSIDLLDGDLSEFELGNIEIKIENQTISSKSKTPDQSMMIFIAICDLLDGVREILSNRKKEFSFVGADSSFSIVFKQKRENAFITHNSKIFSINLISFASVLRNSVDSFLKEKLPLLSENSRNSGVIEDLIISLNEFSKCIS